MVHPGAPGSSRRRTGKLGVCVWGDPDGVPIFRLRGTPGSRMLRDPTACYRLAVCTYERPGYGLSTRRRGYTQAQTADDVAAIDDSLGWERFAVAGASGGSGAALAAACLLPERVTRCAVVVGGGPSTAPELQEAMDEEYRREWELAARGGAGVAVEVGAQPVGHVVRDPGVDVGQADAPARESKYRGGCAFSA